jgi:hypothetical protein
LLESYEVESVVYSKFHLFELKVILLQHNGDSNLIVLSFVSQIVSSGTICIKLVPSIVYFEVAGDYVGVCWGSTFVSQTHDLIDIQNILIKGEIYRQFKEK